MTLRLKEAAKTLPIAALMIVLMMTTGRPLAADDGVLIVQKSTSGVNTQTNQVQLEKNRIRAENGAPGGPEKEAFVFDAAKQVMWIVNYDKKIYSEVTKADVDRIGAQLNDAMAQMRQQMANLPPEKRAQVEAMMRGRGIPAGGPGAAPPKVEYKKIGTDVVAKWTCDKYEGYQNNQKTVELCTVTPEALGFTDADFAISRQLSDFFAKMLPQGADSLFKVGKIEEQGFSGVPVRRTTFVPRQVTSEIVSVSRQRFPDSTFAVPQGFEKRELPMVGRGRGRQ